MHQTKILYISVRADVGGGPVYIDTLINHLNPEWEIFLACPKDEPYFSKWKNNNRVKDIFILPHRKFNVIKLFQLVKFIKHNQIYLIQSNGKGAGIYGRLLKLFHPKIKMIHVFHGVHISQLNYIKKRIYLFVETILSTYLSDLLINVSKGEQESCLKQNFYPINKSIVIYNGVKKRKSNYNPYLNKANSFRIVSLTRFDYAKNMELAYEIAKKFKNNKKIQFIWIGDGEGKKKLQAQSINEYVNVEFTGYIDNDTIIDYLYHADLYLSTSRWEGLPIALLESISIGTPVIATNVIGNNEVVIDDYNGKLFNIDNIESAVKEIEILLNNKVSIEMYSKNAIKVFEENFTVEIMIENHEKAYKNIIK